MRDAFLKVLAFHRVMDLGVGNFAAPAFAEIDLRLALIDEEVKELRDAVAANDLQGAADALGDIAYVINGAAARWGIDLPPVFAEIHASNLTKIGGTRRADGKLLKPKGYKPPDLARVMKESREYWLGRATHWATRPDAALSAPIDAKLYLGLPSSASDERRTPFRFTPRNRYKNDLDSPVETLPVTEEEIANGRALPEVAEDVTLKK